MPDTDNSQHDTSEFADAAKRSQEAGIAYESAAFENARDSTPPSIDEGDPATTDDGSGTSETD